MHAMHNHIDLKDMGGLKNDIPWTRWLFLIGALALAGCPMLAGFFSKDEILAASLNHQYLYPLGIVAVITAALTAFYTFRCYFLVFHGPRRIPDDVEHPHETPIMSYAMVPLALGAIAAGYVSLGHTFSGFLDSSKSIVQYNSLSLIGHTISHNAVAFISLIVFVGGVGLAAFIYLPNRARSEKFAAAYASLHTLLANKFYVDEIYDTIFVRPLRWLGKRCFGVGDNLAIDGILLGIITAVPRFIGWIFQLFQRGMLQTYALLMLIGLAIIIFLIIRQ